MILNFSLAAHSIIPFVSYEYNVKPAKPALTNVKKNKTQKIEILDDENKTHKIEIPDHKLLNE